MRNIISVIMAFLIGMSLAESSTAGIDIHELIAEVTPFVSIEAPTPAPDHSGSEGSESPEIGTMYVAELEELDPPVEIGVIDFDESETGGVEIPHDKEASDDGEAFDDLPDEAEFDDKNVRVSIQLNSPVGILRYGDAVCLECVVDGIEGPYSISWEYSINGVDYFSLGWHLPEYSYILTRDNIDYYYRVVVGV